MNEIPKLDRIGDDGNGEPYACTLKSLKARDKHLATLIRNHGSLEHDGCDCLQIVLGVLESEGKQE